MIHPKILSRLAKGTPKSDNRPILNTIHFEFFDKEYGFYTTLHEGGGLTELPVDALERAIQELGLEANIKNDLQKDIDNAKKKCNEYIQYYCF